MYIASKIFAKLCFSIKEKTYLFNLGLIYNLKNVQEGFSFPVFVFIEFLLHEFYE